DAEQGAAPADRLARFIDGYLRLAREISNGEREPLVFFNDVRALNDPAVNAAYTAMFRRVRDLLIQEPAAAHSRRQANAAAHLVLSELFWSVAWIYEYDQADYERAAKRLFDILYHGLGSSRAKWPPARELALTRDPLRETPQETFLRAATQLINEE